MARTHITPFCVPSLDRADKAATVQNGGTVRVPLSFPSLSVTLSIDETSSPSYLCSVATDPLEGSVAVVKQSSS
jgi:hypothetical protein